MIINYIDPGTGSMLISATVALISVAFFMLKGFIYRKFSIGGSKGDVVDPKELRNIVIYSEGKQYWNVFKNIVEGCSERNIKLSYFTSDKEDPGLQLQLNNVEVKYIGSGREAYYIMNNINANIVLLTTPGLDVLELKKSKGVKHYTHITHATGSIADYKAYGVDYFDSVLLGGGGDIDTIRELESLRRLPKKYIEVVGHTYLDVLRDISNSLQDEELLFNNDKKTILISPTWGMYSLINNVGDKLLSELEKNNDYNIIIRPHPQSFISDKDLMDYLIKKYPNNSSRVWDIGTDNIIALKNSSIMISDYSGIIFDYYSLYKKPIITIQGLFKKEGLDAMDLKEDPWNIRLLDKIGLIINFDDIDNINKIIEKEINNDYIKQQTSIINEIMMYPGESKERSLLFLEDTLNNLEVKLDKINVDETKVNNQLSKLTSILIKLFSLSTLLLLTNIFMLSNFMPDGFTKGLFINLINYSPPLFITTLLLLFISVLLVDKGTFKFSKQIEKIQIIDLVMMLIPLLPIVQYIGANQDILVTKSTLHVLIFFSIVSFTMTVLTPFILSFIIPKVIVSTYFVSMLFTIFNMANYRSTFRYSRIILITLLLFIILNLLIYFKKKNLIVLVTIALFITSLFSNFIQNIDNSKEKLPLTEKDKQFMSYIDNNPLINKPNIYILVYDSYVNQETYSLHGYDNTNQMNYLLDNGFAIYDGTYSIGYTSLKTMAHVVQTTKLVDGTIPEREVISGENTTMYFLNKSNYNSMYIGMSDYMFQGFNPKFSNTYPSNDKSIPPSEIIINAVIEGEFRNDASFSEISYPEYLQEKNRTLSESSDLPTFYYTHDDFPGHTSFYRDFDGGEFDRYFNNIKNSNDEMRKNIESIKKHDSNAIIVVMGDHGPYLTNDGINMKNHVYKDLDRFDLQDRYGTFLAIDWPDEKYNNKYDIKIVQDVMPAIFSYIYNNDELFDFLRLERNTIETDWFHGIAIRDGIITGGKDDGKSIFSINEVRYKIDSE